jgi:O-antigen ligase
MSENASRLADRFLRIGITVCFVIPALAWSNLVPERFMFPKLVVGEFLFFSLGAIGALLGPMRATGGWRSLPWGEMVLLLPVLAAQESLILAGHREGWLWGPGPAEILRLFTLIGIYMSIRWRFSPKSLIGPLLAAGIMNAVVAIAQAAGVSIWETAREGRHAVYGTFGNPNMLAEYLAPLAILGLAVALAARTKVSRVVATVAVLLFLVAMMLTETRAAWLGLIAGLAVFAMLAGDKRIRKVALAAIVLPLVLVALWAPLRSRVLLGASGNDPGVATRSFMWRVALEMFHDHPILGVGPAGYGLRYLDYAAKVQESGKDRPLYAGITVEAHSDPLQLLAEGGIVGLLAWLGVIGWLSWRSFRRIRGQAGSERVYLAAGLAVAMAVAVESLVGFPFRSFPVACLFFWGLAVAVPPADWGLFKSQRILQLLGIVGLCLAVVVLHPFLARAYLGAGAGRPDGASQLERGLRLMPDDGELRFRLGIARMREERMDEAAKEFERALPVFPDPDVRFNLGYLALQKKDYAKAEEWFREGLRRYPYFKAPAWADYALALNGLGRRDEARTAAERALEIDPGLGRARVFLAELDRKGRRR